jgi:hypothetical protein|tara:strand:+ start:1304 stop:1525 length:222 start_codon:yes stop_codon:yes gene_type:complete
MANLVYFLDEKIIRKLKKNPVRGKIVISRQNDEETYKRQIITLSNYFEENNYGFDIKGTREKTHVHYQLKALS